MFSARSKVTSASLSALCDRHIPFSPMETRIIRKWQMDSMKCEGDSAELYKVIFGASSLLRARPKRRLSNEQFQG